MDNEITAEEIAQHYSAAMDSVNLINAVIADPAAYANDETVIQRNVDHLKIMVAKDAIAVDTTEFDNQFN
jgi:hypothetical protein